LHPSTEGKNGGKRIFCFYICGLFNDAVSNSDYTELNDRMNSELERILKEAATV
jgi:hypothetical protein